MHVAKQLRLLEQPMDHVELMPDPGGDYGEVFTRRWIVDLILDLVGYVEERDLASMTLVEPSCGTGAFLVPIVERLIASARIHGHDLDRLAPALRAFDLLAANSDRARKVVASCLTGAGMSHEAAESMSDLWISTEDFLLRDHDSKADFVVGNPPYIRLESVPTHVMDAYRHECRTMRGRADIYVGFIERGLELLRAGGTLGYICADRWMHNQYGSQLRGLISQSFAVDTVIGMHDVNAFEDDVSAYPAVIVLRNDKQTVARVVNTTAKFDQVGAAKVVKWAKRSGRHRMTGAGFDASHLDGWFAGDDLWPSGSPPQLAIIRDLESRFPLLEDPRTGTRVGIGIATGCDEVYITDDPNLVERERLLPLLQAPDIAKGVPNWSGSFLVNPWNGSGLVNLKEFPRLREFLDQHGERLRARHVARRRPAQWYRTIDRVDQRLQSRPKLVMPDLKAASHPVLDEGSYYPHHNLYYVISDGWDLEVLGGLLLSDITNLFVGSYCVKMRGGCYRFQAQYLRRLRVPYRAEVGAKESRALARAFQARDVEAATATAARLYGLEGLPRTA
jgi:hypothetical protein